MRISEFKEWLRLKYPESKETVSNAISYCKTVEKNTKQDLDVLFDTDRCETIINELTYSTDDERRKIKPKHIIPIEGDIRTNSAKYKQSVKLYVEFRMSLPDLTRIENEKVKMVLVKYRLQQGPYREKLKAHWEGCSITGCKNNDVLIASHIKSFSECEEEEKYDVNNGLLLTPTYDKLFDIHLISFDNEGKIIISKSVDSEDLISLGITGNETLRMEKITPKTQDHYLMQHKQKFEQEEKKRLSVN